MGMNVGSAGDFGEEDRVVSEINTTPLVDVMLVLLIIFLITIPVVTTSVKVDLPKEKNVLQEAKPENIIISVREDGKIFMYDTPIASARDLTERLKKFSKKDPQPEIHIRGDGRGKYSSVGKVIYAVQLAGMVKVSFVTEPPSNN
jgi:biopolymer transport protein ExbD